MIQEEENEASLADKFEADPLADLTVIMIRDPCDDFDLATNEEETREVEWPQFETLMFEVEPLEFSGVDNFAGTCPPTFTCET